MAEDENTNSEPRVESALIFAVGVALLFTACSAAPLPPATDEAAAVVVAGDAVMRQQVVAVGRDLEFAGDARTDVVVLAGDARIEGRILGDLIVLGGDVLLRSTARLRGDVFVLGGDVEVETGATVDGRTVAYPQAPSSWLVLAEGPGLGGTPLSREAFLLKFTLLLAWLLVSAFLVLGFEEGLQATASSVLAQPFRNFFVGLVALLALTVCFGLLTATVPAAVGAPFLVMCAAAALVCKLWGTVAVFMALGFRLLPRRLVFGSRATIAVLCGLAGLGVIKMVPYVGEWAWTIVTCVGIGAAATSRLGRLDPWFADLD